MIKVLFTGGGGAGSELLWRLLNNQYECHFADADEMAIDPSIPTSRRHKLCWANDPEFVPDIISLCRRLKIDILVPSVDEELLLLARSRTLLAPTLPLLPSAEYVEVMLDKLSMIRILASHGVDVPTTYTLADDFKDMLFPCIAKPRKGRGSRGLQTIETYEAAAQFRLQMGEKASDVLLQEKIVGTEYTVQMISDSNTNLCAIVPVRVRLKRGITLRAEITNDSRVIAACKAIHERVPASGCYNIQLMLTADGRVLPFEINPRISTTFCMSIAAGIDPFVILLGQVESDGNMSVTPGLKLSRHWMNHLSM